MNFKELFRLPGRDADRAAPVLLDPSAMPTGGQSGGKRANHIPLVLICFFLFLFLAGVVYVANERSKNRIGSGTEQKTTQQREAHSANQMANDLTAGWHDGVIPSSRTQQEKPNNTDQVPPPKDLSDPNADKNKNDTKKDTFDSFAEGQNQFEDPHIEDRLRIRERRVQALEAALQSKMGVQVSELHTSQGTTAASVNAQIRETRQQLANLNDPTAAYQARLAQMRGDNAGAGAGRGTDALYQATSSGKNDVKQFEQNDSWRLDTQLEPPESPYMLRTGCVIPATMISGINSELPGQVMAQVSQNVYDTATGRSLLVPQGTRLIGAYSSDVAFGQERILMAWQRLIFPDGKVLDIRAMPGADSAGNAGFTDKVNNHWFRTISSAVLLSGVIAAASMSQDKGGNSNTNGNDRQRANDALSEALGQTLGNTLSQVISKNLNIAPTLEIRPGYRFNVMIVKDMALPGSYHSFDYR